MDLGRRNTKAGSPRDAQADDRFLIASGKSISTLVSSLMGVCLTGAAAQTHKITIHANQRKPLLPGANIHGACDRVQGRPK
jgi:hypothetical protein